MSSFCQCGGKLIGNVTCDLTMCNLKLGATKAETSSVRRFRHKERVESTSKKREIMARWFFFCYFCQMVGCEASLWSHRGGLLSNGGYQLPGWPGIKKSASELHVATRISGGGTRGGQVFKTAPQAKRHKSSLDNFHH